MINTKKTLLTKVSQFNDNKFGFHTGRHQFGEWEDRVGYHESLVANQGHLQGQRKLYLRSRIPIDWHVVVSFAGAILHGLARLHRRSGREPLMRIYKGENVFSGKIRKDIYFINNWTISFALGLFMWNFYGIMKTLSFLFLCTWVRKHNLI